ncbi:MAG: hypothetical protein ACTIJA_04470, partial [Bavariicoccus seileri]|uniref:hypothetical protein n=1 Tax=Bavariicoccus seileri TaxID=549685 RepID=UPI003F99FB3D
LFLCLVVARRELVNARNTSADIIINIYNIQNLNGPREVLPKNFFKFILKADTTIMIRLLCPP